jgi:hypothetical protein
MDNQAQALRDIITLLLSNIAVTLQTACPIS